jgi:hypothetical protein
MTTVLVQRLDQSPSRLAELNHTGLQITEWAFNKTKFLLVVGKEIVPKRVLKQTKLDPTIN